MAMNNVSKVAIASYIGLIIIHDGFKYLENLA